MTLAQRHKKTMYKIAGINCTLNTLYAKGIKYRNPLKFVKYYNQHGRCIIEYRKELEVLCKKYTIKELSEKLGITRPSVSRLLIRNGLKAKSPFFS